jgi:hypothetical protein
MKRISFIFPLFIILLVTPQLFASTNVGALLSENTQWDQTGSPYIVQSRVLVRPGVTLEIGPGVQVIFQGPATLQISGELKVEGSAAAPAVFNMTDSGLQSTLFIDGGDAELSNAKVLSGVFLAQDATIHMDGCEVTKGSGLYLKGNTTARLKNNKFYGNATGVVLDGPVAVDMQFNTLVQNTYGLYLKSFSKLTFLNNSVHDNDSEVVNNGSKAKMGGNYWGTMNPQTVNNKIKGTVSLSPMRDIKDILRAYLRSELPVITKAMSDQAEKEDELEENAAKEALKEYRKKQHETEISTIEAKNQMMTPVVVATPTDTFTPVVVPALAPASDLVVPPAPSTESTLPVPSNNASSSEPQDFGANIPMPPSSDSSAPEPPALGDLAANAATSAPPPMVNTPTTVPTDTPVPQDTGMELLPPPSDLTSSVPESSLPTAVSQEPAMDNLSSSTQASPSPTPQGTSDDLASIVATAQSAVTNSENSTPTPIPTVELPDLGNDLDTPPVSSSSVVSDTPTFTSTPTSTPFIPTSTPTPVVSNAAPAVSAAPGSLVPIAPNTAAPPPDFGDNSNSTASQPPMPNANTSSSLPAPAAPSSDQNPKPASTPQDVDGMQAPPMDSGLDFAVPKN